MCIRDRSERVVLHDQSHEPDRHDSPHTDPQASPDHDRPELTAPCQPLLSEPPFSPHACATSCGMYACRHGGGGGMLSIAKAHKDYYLQKLGEISPREDYYLRGGTAKGRWHGSGTTELGLEGTVSGEGLVRLFDGQNPATGEQLGRRIRKDGVSAWDLTFSADKSVSLLWAFGDDEVRRQVVEAFEEATGEAVAYLESVASSTRGASRVPVTDRGGKPILDEDGTTRFRVETWPIRTTG